MHLVVACCGLVDGSSCASHHTVQLCSEDDLPLLPTHASSHGVSLTGGPFIHDSMLPCGSLCLRVLSMLLDVPLSCVCPQHRLERITLPNTVGIARLRLCSLCSWSAAATTCILHAVAGIVCFLLWLHIVDVVADVPCSFAMFHFVMLAFVHIVSV